MYRIGLTGGIASGKSTAAQMLRDLGAAVIDADQVAREIVMPGQPAYAELVRTLGRGVLHTDGQLDRKRLAAIVFSDQELREQLNAITHPRVQQRMDFLAGRLEDGGYRLPVVMDIPLLIEAGMQHTVDEIWLVVVEPKLQLERLKERDGLSQQAAKARIAAQLPLASKLPWATEVIDNNGDLDHTKLQVQQCWARALLRASKFADQKE